MLHPPAQAGQDAARLGSVKGQARPIGQQGIGRQQPSQAIGFIHRFEIGQRHRASQTQRAAAGAAQTGEVSATAQRLADVLGQGADVGSLAARHVDHQAGILPVDDVDGVNRDLARCALDFETGTGVLVERTAVLLQRRVHRRHLGDRPGEALQHLLDQGPVDVDRPLLQHFALKVAGAGAPTQTQRRAVSLVGIQAYLAELGRSAEAQRQQASGQRIEGSRVTCFLGTQQPLGFLQSVVARPAQWLVEQQHTVQRTADLADTDGMAHDLRARRLPWHASNWLRGSAPRVQPRARWCGQTGNARSARCGSAIA